MTPARFAIALFAGLWERFGSRARTPSGAASLPLLGLGAVLGLVVLSRLDGGLLAVAAALLLFLREARTAGFGAGLSQKLIPTLGA